MMTFCGSLQYGPLHRTIDLTYHWTSGTSVLVALLHWYFMLTTCKVHLALLQMSRWMFTDWAGALQTPVQQYNLLLVE